MIFNNSGIHGAFPSKNGLKSRLSPISKKREFNNIVKKYTRNSFNCNSNAIPHSTCRL